ncbi:hypothetical protein FOA52_004206 [Chlamydomonas sp. UWO 241]|nr:hypothetical protein FOA52_004206 [Chlamydomonas sp. UWO 241]
MAAGGECVYVRGALPTSNNGMVCRPGITFRRLMLNRASPGGLSGKDLIVTDDASNRSAVVPYQHYNDDGYMFVVPSGRGYTVRWDTPTRLDPSSFSVHSMDPLGVGDYVDLSVRYVQRERTPDGVFYGNETYNSTRHVLFLAGNCAVGARVNVIAQGCPTGGCTNEPEVVIDVRDGTLLWSDAETWSTREGGAPQAGDNVTIPYGWDLVIDVDTPLMEALVVQGNVTFSRHANVTLSSTYILVFGTGYLWAGQRHAPHPANATATISLSGSRDTPDFVVSDELNLGSKVLAALNGGRLDLYGTPVPTRWARLSAFSETGDEALVVEGESLGWPVGGRVVVASSSWNPWQAEVRTIASAFTDATHGTTTLLLASPLSHPHSAHTRTYPGLPMIDMRAEVGLLSSNVRVVPSDGDQQYSVSGTSGTRERYGSTLIIAGNASARLSHIELSQCGQAYGRPALSFLGLLPVNASSGRPADALAYGGADGACTTTSSSASNASNASSNGSTSAGPSDGSGGSAGGVCDEEAAPEGLAANATGTSADLAPNPSHVSHVSVAFSMAGALVVTAAPTAAASSGQVPPSMLAVSGCVLYESFDAPAVEVRTGAHASIMGNLALGTIIDLEGAAMNARTRVSPRATFELHDGAVVVASGNVAAGSEGVGWLLHGPACDSGSDAAGSVSFSNNSAHSNVVGVWLKSSAASRAAGCTALANATVWMSWDFGVVTTGGIDTHVLMEHVNVLDSKHAGVMLLKRGLMHDPGEVNITGGVVAGASHPLGCSFCSVRTAGLEDGGAFTGDAGCPAKVAPTSYNRRSPFSAACGLVQANFALAFTPGPPRYPWDGLKGYPTLLGIARHVNVTFADFPGAACGSGAYALANHGKQPDAFHPHHFWGTRLINVTEDGLLLLEDSDPAWRNEADCGEATFDAPTGETLLLNCAGPRHALFRDMDGAMLGTGGVPAAFAGHFGGDGRLTYDQGTPLSVDACTLDAARASYTCSSNSSAWDPQLFVFESRDTDSETRNFAPVFVNVSGSVDLLVPAMDQSWCFGYTCTKRISNFHTYVPTGGDAPIDLSFAGTPPRFSRLWLPYADADAEVVIAVKYQDTLRRFAWTTAAGRIFPLDAPPLVGDGTPHGSYHWDRTTMTFTVKLGGGRNVELRTENAVEITTTLSMSVDDFYDTQATFIEAIAQLLNIPTSRIIIARVVAGSVVVTYELYDDPASVEAPIADVSPSTDGNVDAETSAVLAAMTEEERAALYDAYMADNAAYADSTSSGDSSSSNNTVVSVSELADLISVLYASQSTGALAVLLGVPVAAMSIDTSLASSGSLSPFVLASINTVAEAVNTGSPVPAPGTTPSGSGGGGGSSTTTTPGTIIVSPGGGGGGSDLGDGTGTGGNGGGGSADGSGSGAAGDASGDGSGSGGSVAVIAGTVGGVCVAALLAALAAVLVVRRRTQRQSQGDAASAAAKFAADGGTAPPPAAVARSGPSRSKVEPSASSKRMQVSLPTDEDALGGYGSPPLSAHGTPTAHSPTVRSPPHMPPPFQVDDVAETLLAPFAPHRRPSPLGAAGNPRARVAFQDAPDDAAGVGGDSGSPTAAAAAAAAPGGPRGSRPRRQLDADFDGSGGGGGSGIGSRAGSPTASGAPSRARLAAGDPDDARHVAATGAREEVELSQRSRRDEFAMPGGLGATSFHTTEALAMGGAAVAAGGGGSAAAAAPALAVTPDADESPPTRDGAVLRSESLQGPRS